MLDELPRLQYMILKAYEDGKTRLSDNDAALLKKWKPAFTSNDIMKLAAEGENEMIDLGERYQARFPSLMPEVYSNQTYRVCVIKHLLNINFITSFCKLFFDYQLLNFSLGTPRLNAQRKVQDILLLDYLVGEIASMFRIQNQYIETQ